MLSQLKKIFSFKKSLKNNENGIASKSKISDLNTDCFQRLVQFLNLRDITALSVATRLWLTDIPLVYEEITAYRQRDIVPFLENCGIFLKCFSIAKPHYMDFRLYQLLQLIDKCCPNIESIDVVFSQQTADVEHYFVALDNVLNLKTLRNLALTVPLLNNKSACYLNKLKCLPRLRSLKINCASSVSLDLCIQQCRQLRILHVPGCALLLANTVLSCINLEELKVTAERDITKERHSKLHRRRCAVFGALKQLRNIKILHLAANACLSDEDVLDIELLPQLQHLTLQHFTICRHDRDAVGLLPLGALAKLEEAHFVNIRYKGIYFDCLIFNLVTVCPKLKFLRLSEMDFRISKLVFYIALHKIQTRNARTESPKLNILVEQFKHWNYILRNFINGLSNELQQTDILQIEFVDVAKRGLNLSDVFIITMLIIIVIILLVKLV